MTQLAARPRRRLPRLLVAAALVLTGALALPRAQASAPGLVLVSERHLSNRLLELTLRTPLLPQDTKVRVLLPAGYATTSKRYPVLYLLNGGGGSYLDWTVSGDAEKTTARTQAIVVMPDGGTGGNYTDWYGTDGSGFRPRWEDYHLGQLLPWVDRHFRTLARRDQRAIAGLSMGGNGALHYAARHPDLFVAAASFSGANDVFNPIIRPITETTGITEGCLPGAVFGPSATEELRWRAFNPVDLAANLKGTWVSLRFGNGQPGGPDGSAGVDVIETAVHQANVKLHEALLAAGVPHRYDDYGAGQHNWFYWSRDLRQELPAILAVFAQHRAAPSTVTYWSADASYEVFGWHVHLTRAVAETSRLVDADVHGFRLQGTGTAVVTTPAAFAAGRRMTVTVHDVRGPRRLTYRVGSDRRVTVSVDLGPSNSAQQYTAQAKLLGTTVREARVELS